jgi:hypothetical protein
LSSTRFTSVPLSRLTSAGATPPLDLGPDADRLEAGVRFLGLAHHIAQRALGLGHRRLLLRLGQVVAADDRLGLGDLAGLVVDDHLEVLVAFHRVDRQL